MNRFEKIVGITLVFLILSNSVGCSTVESIDLPDQQLQEQIRTGKIIQPGDIVTIVTPDKSYEDIRVTALREDSLHYEKNVLTDTDTIDENTFEKGQVVEHQTFEIPISEIVAVEKKEATAIGTAAVVTGAVVGISAFYYLLFFVLPAAIVAAAI